jgi:hypothetical protein
MQVNELQASRTSRMWMGGQKARTIKKMERKQNVHVHGKERSRTGVFLLLLFVFTGGHTGGSFFIRATTEATA